ncbi:probable RNA-binding protein ARP1 isoform X2 [Arachis hypogaea]|uniref:probable RNA-binding protein ARP1 isoform X2 n=1 Tax=Arachis hypogaea TaxID=3818 RepID=UPI000DECD064|nr:probable RNA-binding protein ARP1 isoform X2 [Arachis hypogaea]
MMSNNNIINNNNIGERGGGQFGDTTLTKVFVGGLAWETPMEALRQHFEKYGEILEAVIISDKLTGRSKGYGFVTFKEAEAAKKACEEQASLVINGRKANCNLASLGARRPRSNNSSPPPQPKGAEGSNGGGGRNNGSSTPSGNHVQWYYPVGAPPSPYHHHHHHPTVPFYGYPTTPTYIATDMMNYNYNQKMGYGGAYMSGAHLSHVYPRHAMVGANTLMPMYPLYHYHLPTETMGVPAHYYHPTVTTGHYAAALPAGIVSKPASMTPHTVGSVDCFKAVV